MNLSFSSCRGSVAGLVLVKGSPVGPGPGRLLLFSSFIRSILGGQPFSKISSRRRHFCIVEE